MVAPSSAAPAEASLEPALRQLSDRYRSLFVIGEGGMGRVEVALQRSGAGFERIVALKRLLPRGPRDARQVQMFLREARIATLLTHPNVVHAFSFGEAEGELFLAMQYVDGEPLSRVLAAAMATSGGLEPVVVAWVLAEACDGLHAAHELRDVDGKPLRVVHRDVSPHNVMISYDGNVKVVDFGIARFDSGGLATRTGEVKGKLAYMSPEQALGEELDRRSDVFSMGAVLFECLTGRRMWGEGTDLELMRKIALERPPRIDAILPGAPAALVDLQARMVGRDPETRPDTALDIAAQLRAFAVAAAGPTSRRMVAATMTALFAGDARRRRDRAPGNHGPPDERAARPGDFGTKLPLARAGRGGFARAGAGRRGLGASGAPSAGTRLGRQPGADGRTTVGTDRSGLGCRADDRREPRARRVRRRAASEDREARRKARGGRQAALAR